MKIPFCARWRSLGATMSRSRSMVAVTAIVALSSIIVGCRDDSSTAAPSSTDATDESEHGHVAGAHGGQIVSLGRDSYHMEAIFDADGRVRLYTCLLYTSDAADE